MEKIKIKGIDISEFQGDVDFTKVKDEVQFVYIRATYGRFGIDKRFKEYTSKCIENNIPFGFYYYSYATNEDLAEDEVKFFLQNIRKYKEEMTFPAMIDMEDSDGYKLNHGNPDKETLTKICKKACEKIIEENITPVIYASADWFTNKLDEEQLSNYIKWIAWWETKEENIDVKKYTIWQYSSKGKINGIHGQVDLDYSFVDFSRLKEYVKNISKINFIKSKTAMTDLEIQYLSCYKWGQDLINKIHDRLKEDEKINYDKNLAFTKKLLLLQKYYKLETKTINFISLFLYAEETVEKLLKAITKEGIITIKN